MFRGDQQKVSECLQFPSDDSLIVICSINIPPEQLFPHSNGVSPVGGGFPEVNAFMGVLYWLKNYAMFLKDS